MRSDLDPTEYRAWWEANAPVPYGFCWCGCEQKTRLARQSHTVRGYVKGEPIPHLDRHQRRNLSSAQEAEAVSRYEGGESSHAIADDLGVSGGYIVAAAKRRGIAIRPSASERRRSEQEELAICEVYNSSRANADKIGEAFGCSGSYVRAVVKRHGFSLRPPGAQRKYVVNDHYFNSVDSEPKAYWLGFLAADGSVGHTVQLRFSFIATPNFCLAAQRFLEVEAKARRTQPRPVADGKMAVLSYTGTLQVSRIYRLLHESASVWLPRKRSVVAEHVRSERRNWTEIP